MEPLFVQTKEWMLSRLSFFPSWMIALCSIGIGIGIFCALGPVIMMYLTLFERKVIARMQNRIGPNRVGKIGWLQPIADGVKMFTKEDIVPKRADKLLHYLAPVLMVAPALLIFAVIPFGRNMLAVDLNVGVLFFMAVSSTSVIAVITASWASRNKFSLLGGMRSAAQMISYEVPMVMATLPVIMTVQSLSTREIVEAQSGLGGLRWFLFTPWGFFSFIIFFLCAVAETNRSPFDLPEAESEIVAGFHTEYSGMKFAMFYMAEYMNVFTISAMTVTLFLGGWQGPFLPSWVWFFAKTIALIFVMCWFRGTLPRFRVDQLMGFAWKFLLPLALINIFLAGFLYYRRGWESTVIAWAAVVVVYILLGLLNRNLMPEKRIYTYGDSH